MISPKPLKKGDKIGIVAPSRKIASHELENAIALISGWGYDIALGKNLYNEYHQFAGNDESRAADFTDMISNPGIKAIISARGGYGTVRLLELLDPELIRKNPKWVIGYSDITVLHSYFNKVAGCETIHGSMPVNCLPGGIPDGTWEMIRKILEGTMIDYEIETHPMNRTGKVTGELVGGNLSVLYSLRGSFCDIDTRGKILFIEDLDEYLYHIDRMMMNLKISGILKNLKGLIVGGMTDMKDNKVPFGKDANDIIADAVADYNFPVVYNFPAGHCEPNLPLILGRKIILDVQAGKTKIEFFDANAAPDKN